MTKATMPEPVAWATPDLSKLFGENEMLTLERLGGSREKQKTFFSVPLITTAQAEAYAEAMVRVALEEVAEIADTHNAFATYDAIRALIPTTKKPMSPTA